MHPARQRRNYSAAEAEDPDSLTGDRAAGGLSTHLVCPSGNLGP